MKTKPIIRFLCALLFLSLLLSILLMSVFAENNGDFSYPCATNTKTLYADQILEQYVAGTVLSEAEKEFLRAESGFSITYNSIIPTSYIKTDYQDGTLTVTAEKYTYIASNGTEVVWTPTEATVYGKTEKFVATPYTVSFFGLAPADKDKVEIIYTAEFRIDKSQINRLLNLGYNEAPKLKEDVKTRREEYESAHAQYLADSRLYSEYLSALALYNAYLSEKRIYDEKNAEYLKYLTELDEYNQAIKAYDEYVIAKEKYHLDLAEYTKYLAYAEQNMAKIEAYEKYQNNFAKVQAQLNIIKATKTQLTSLKRTVYSAIMGDTVTAVIDNKGDVVKVLKADENVVDMAGVATVNLRILLKEFFAISENDIQAQYQYYVTNYEAFRDNFTNLLVALDNLYLTQGVRAAMIAQEKHEKYLILVAQLYHIANALSDEPIKSYDGNYLLDSNYVIGIAYSEDKWVRVSEALENEEFIADDNSAEPLDDGYPIEPEVPEYRAMQEPVMPTPVTLPIKPEPVSEPAPPQEVPSPQMVENPGKEPTEPIFSDAVINIIAEYEDGRIFERAYYTGADVVLRPKITVSKIFVGAEQVTVTYYSNEYLSESAQEVMYSISVDKGTAVDYFGEIPTKPEDSEFIYRHCGWTDETGNKVDFSSINSSVKLYPSFSAIKKEYKTKWVVNGEEFFENPGTPALPGGEMYYDFSGWNKTVDSASGDVTYIAVFDRALVPTASGPSKVTFTDGNYVAEPPAVANKFDISSLIKRASGVGGITIRTLRGEEICVSYAETIKMSEAGVHTIEFLSVKNSNGYAYIVNLYGEDGAQLHLDSKVTFKSSCEVLDLSHFILYSRGEDGTKNLLRYSFDNGAIGFLASVGKTYYAKVEYALTPLPLDAVKIELDKSFAGYEETVSLSLEYAPGIRIDRVYFMNSKGEKTTVFDLSFKMPGDDITVGVDYTVEQYTVTFISDGKTIVRYLCSYGDTVSPPPAPKKASNDKYSYEFIGWSPDVTAVDGNVTYIARYSATPVAPKDTDNTEISGGVLKLLLLGFVGLGCFIGIVIPSSIMTVVVISRRKKRFLKQDKPNKHAK